MTLTKMLTIAILVPSLTACTIFTKQPEKRDAPVVVQTKLVPLTIPDEMLAMPPYPAAVDPRKMTDRDLALWLIENEKRNEEIGKKLEAIRKYQEQRLKDLQPAL